MTSTNRPDSVRWCRKSCPCKRERGSADRCQMRAYALGVAVALVGRPACVHCGATVSLTQGEVDRTVPGACYKPGSVIMTCRACNNARNTETLAGETRYVADVARASVGVTMMGPTAARRLYLSVKDEGQLGASPYKSA